jgi:hypothetical protein
MAGPVPTIYVLLAAPKTWTADIKPAMTKEGRLGLTLNPAS